MKCMLAKPYTGQDVTGWYASEKLDGIRAKWEGSKLISRNEKPFYAPQWFLDKMPPFDVEGELALGRNLFQQTMSVVRKKTPHDGWDNITFILFDLLEDSMTPFDMRNTILEESVDKSRHVYVLPQIVIKNEEHLKFEYDHILSLNGEGLIVKHPKTLYEQKRSKYMLKMKPTEEDEGVLINYEPGFGKYVNMVGALKLEWKDKIIHIGSGLSDADRSAPPPIGSKITFAYQSLTDSGMPRFPVYKGVRDYE